MKSVITWIPVSERLPEDGKLRLVAFESNVNIALYERRTWYWQCYELPVFNVTHWADLPQPPASKERKHGN